MIYLLIVSWSTTGYAKALPEDNQCDHFSYNTAIYQDTSVQKNLHSIMQLPEYKWREMAPAQLVNLGYSQDATWIKLRLTSDDNVPICCFIELKSTRIDYLDWYIMDGTNLLKEIQAGNLQHPSASKVDVRKPTINLTLPAGSTRDVYLRLTSGASMQIYLTVKASKAFVEYTARAEARNTLLIGCMFGLLLLAYLFTWATGLRANYLYATGMNFLTLVLPLAGGYYYWFRIPGQAFWNHTAVVLFTNIGYIFLVLHCSIFLRLKTHMPRWHRLMMVTAAVMFISTLAAIMIPYQAGVQICIAIILITPLIMLVTSSIAWIKGNEAARFYLPANSLFWLYSFSQALFYYGVIHVLHILPETYGMVCIIISMLLFFMAMARHVQLLRRQKEAAQAHALHLQQNMTQDLERLVEARTHELNQTKNEAEQANLAKTNFFSQISHDLRAPLNWLIGLAESLWLESEDLQLSDEFKAYLQHIKTGGYYLFQLTNNIMDINAIEAGHNTVRNEEFNIKDWSQSLEAVALTVAKSCNVSLNWKLDCPKEGDCVFRTDPIKMSQILMNLVHNAVKFTPAGNNVYVTISCEKDDLRFIVEDEGQGIPDEDKEIFDSYSQLKAQQGYLFQGVGLGLHIVKCNLDALNGSIEIHNRKDKGAVFIVDVPEQPEITGEAD